MWVRLRVMQYFTFYIAAHNGLVRCGHQSRVRDTALSDANPHSYNQGENGYSRLTWIKIKLLS